MCSVLKMHSVSRCTILLLSTAPRCPGLLSWGLTENFLPWLPPEGPGGSPLPGKGARLSCGEPCVCYPLIFCYHLKNCLVFPVSKEAEPNLNSSEDFKEGTVYKGEGRVKTTYRRCEPPVENHSLPLPRAWKRGLASSQAKEGHSLFQKCPSRGT